MTIWVGESTQFFLKKVQKYLVVPFFCCIFVIETRTHNNMKTQTRNAFITALTNVINDYVENNELFAGGCCYSAYLITSALKKAHIKYDVMMYQYQEIINVNNFNDAINGNGVSHVAVAVRYNRRKMVIGSCEGIHQYFSATGYEYKVWTYKNVDPQELLAGYKHNNWNRCWNTRLNKCIAKEIERIVLEYVGEEIELDKTDLYKKEREERERVIESMPAGELFLRMLLGLI